MNYFIKNIFAEIDFKCDIEKIRKLPNTDDKGNLIVLKLKGTTATYLIFKHGKLMITGIKSEDKLKEAIKIFENITKE